ncbi:MAG TPA: DNA repair protein RadA, partial [Nitrospiraceae bacterium]|nr:DNA repair protein RadA [Nitrospiraceae bacterium]
MRAKTTFHCQACGHQAPRWLGRCPDCGQWNSFKEIREAPASRGRPQALTDQVAQPTALGEIELAEEPRLPTG